MLEVDRRLVAAAGIRYATAELLRCGYLALPTTRSMKGVDIVVTHQSKTVKVRVKTNQDRPRLDSWRIGRTARSELLLCLG